MAKSFSDKITWHFLDLDSFYFVLVNKKLQLGWMDTTCKNLYDKFENNISDSVDLTLLDNIIERGNV